MAYALEMGAHLGTAKICHEYKIIEAKPEHFLCLCCGIFHLFLWISARVETYIFTQIFIHTHPRIYLCSGAVVGSVSARLCFVLCGFVAWLLSCCGCHSHARNTYKKFITSLRLS